MAIDIIYTVLLIKLGSNSLYRSTNRSSLQRKDKRNVKFYFVKTELLFTCFLSLRLLPGRTSALCLSVKEHQTTEVNSKLQQHSQHRIEIEDVW